MSIDHTQSTEPRDTDRDTNNVDASPLADSTHVATEEVQSNQSPPATEQATMAAAIGDYAYQVISRHYR
ncbi:MAG: hypothetical protein NZ772_13915, partial [Cyanobacteria bacterium]|nr:hypothetical protein [Cyanobacteriota bacterium]